MAQLRQRPTFNDRPPMSPVRLPFPEGGSSVGSMNSPHLHNFKLAADASGSHLSVLTTCNISDMNYRDAPTSPSASSVTTLSNYDSLASPEPPMPAFSYDNDRIQNNLLEEICSDIGIKDAMDLDFLDFDTQFDGSSKTSGGGNQNSGVKGDGADFDQIIPFGQMEGRHEGGMDLDSQGMSMYGEGLVSGQTTVVASPAGSPRRTPSTASTRHLQAPLDTPCSPGPARLPALQLPRSATLTEAFSPFKPSVRHFHISDKPPSSPLMNRGGFNLRDMIGSPRVDPTRKLTPGYTFAPAEGAAPTTPTRTAFSPAPAPSQFRVGVQSTAPGMILEPISPPPPASPPAQHGQQSSDGTSGSKSVTFASPLVNINNISCVSLSRAASQEHLYDLQASSCGAREAMAERPPADHKPELLGFSMGQGPASAEGPHMEKQGTSTFCYKPQVNLPMDFSMRAGADSGLNAVTSEGSVNRQDKDMNCNAGESFGAKGSQETCKTSRPVDSPFDQGYFSVGSPSLCASSQCESAPSPPPFDEQSATEKVMHFLQKGIPGSTSHTQSMSLCLSRGQPVNMSAKGAQVALPRSSASVGPGGQPQPLPTYHKLSSREDFHRNIFNTGQTTIPKTEVLPTSRSAQQGSHEFSWEMPPNVTLSNLRRRPPSPAPSKVLVAQPMMSVDGPRVGSHHQHQALAVPQGRPAFSHMKTPEGVASPGLGVGGVDRPPGSLGSGMHLGPPHTPRSVSSAYPPSLATPHSHLKSEHQHVPRVKTESVDNPFAVPFPPNKTVLQSEQLLLPAMQGEHNTSLQATSQKSGSTSLTLGGFTPHSAHLSQFSNLPATPHQQQGHPAPLAHSPLSDQFGQQGLAPNPGQHGLMQVLIRDKSSAFRSHPLFPLLRDLIIADMNYYSKEFPFQLIENLPTEFDKLLQNYLQRNPPSGQYYGNQAVESVIMDALKYAHQTLIEKIHKRKEELTTAKGQPGSTVDDFCERFDRAVQSSLNVSRGPADSLDEMPQFPPNQCINPTYSQMLLQQEAEQQQQQTHYQQQHLQQQQQQLHLQQQPTHMQQQQQQLHLQQHHTQYPQQHLQQQQPTNVQQQQQHIQQQQQHIQQQQFHHQRQQQHQYMQQQQQQQLRRPHESAVNAIQIEFPNDRGQRNNILQAQLGAGYPSTHSPLPHSHLPSHNAFGNTKLPLMPSSQAVNLRDLLPPTPKVDLHSGLHELAHADRNSESSFVSARSSNCLGSENGSTAASKRQVLPKEAVAVMLDWLRLHQDNPYPNDEEKEILMYQTRLSISQINYWFTNARRRILPKWTLKRLLDEQAQRGGSTQEITAIIEKNKLSTKEAIRLASSLTH